MLNNWQNVMIKYDCPLEVTVTFCSSACHCNDILDNSLGYPNNLTILSNLDKPKLKRKPETLILRKDGGQVTRIKQISLIR